MAVITKTPKGEEIAILSRKEYDRFLALDEDAADAAAARMALDQLESGQGYTLTSRDMDDLLAAKTPLAFFRKKSGMSQAQFAKRVGIAQGFLSEIESGLKKGDIQTLRKMADTLGLSLDDLVPSLVKTKDRSKTSGRRGTSD